MPVRDRPERRETKGAGGGFQNGAGNGRAADVAGDRHAMADDPRKPVAADDPGERASSAFLAAASRLLADSLDYERTLATVAGLALPGLGAWCIVDVVEPNGAMRRLAIVHPDPELRPLVHQLQHSWPPEHEDPLGLPAALRTRQPELVPEVTESLLARVARDEANLALLRRLRLGSFLVVPLIARGQVLGAITFISGKERRYTPADVALADDLSARAAIAIDNARLYRAARAARVEAEAANRAKGQFLAIMSHELRTPLNAILGYAQLLEMGIDGPLPEGSREKLGRIQASGRHLLGLINEVLDVARVESGRVELQREVASVADAVAAALSMVTPEAAACGLAVDDRCAGTDARFRGDPLRVRQILVNLLTNACKFTRTGGQVTLSCELVPDAPATQPHRTGPWTAIHVEDNGIGIPPERLEAIFEPFVQADSELTRSQGGAGLGLAISRQLARLMDGELLVESEPGRGSRFTLLLPAPAAGNGAGSGEGAAESALALTEAAQLINLRTPAILEGYLRRQRAAAGVDRGAGASDLELWDHAQTLLGAIAQALLTAAAGEEGIGLREDGARIQETIGALRGAQRARLGWDEEAFRGDLRVLREAILAELHATPGAQERLRAAVAQIEAVFDRVERAGVAVIKDQG
jgi:signal transduction histidine kinase